jgi:hypothetical protein
MAIPKKVEARLIASLKRYQPILEAARARDINEPDTVTIVKDVLSDLFGYEKYSELTSEFAIRGTFCDLAVKIDGRLELLVEVKAIGLELRDPHVKQAVDYAANQGIEWVVLTNGIAWRVYRVSFSKPIDKELVYEMNLLEMSSRYQQHLDYLHMLTREAMVRASLPEFHAQLQATSRFLLGAILLSDPVTEIVRRELRRITPGVRIELADIRTALANEVLKREVVEGDKAEEAKRKVARAASKTLRAANTKRVEAPSGVESSADPVESAASEAIAPDAAASAASE